MNNILVIPRHIVTLRFIDVPSLDDAEIKKMVEFQALKVIPYPKEEMVISYRSLGSYKDGFSSIMLVIARRQIIEEKLKEEAQKIEGIRLYTELLYLFLLKKNIIATDKVNLVIHIGKDESELMIIDKKRPIFSRGFKNSDRFFEEIDHSVLAYKKEKKNPKIETIDIIYPSSVDIKDARSHIEGHFNIPVSFSEYSEALSDVDLPAEIDLLPGELTDKKKKIQKKYEIIFTSSLIGLTVLLFLSFLLFKFHEKKKILQMFSSKVKNISLEIDRLDGFVKKIDIAERHLGQGKFITKILADIYATIPRDISITGLNYDGKDKIFYNGNTKDTSSVFNFVKLLEGSEYFEEVDVKYATKKKVKGEQITDFNIQCKLK